MASTGSNKGRENSHDKAREASEAGGDTDSLLQLQQDEQREPQPPPTTAATPQHVGDDKTRSASANSDQAANAAVSDHPVSKNRGRKQKSQKFNAVVVGDQVQIISRGGATHDLTRTHPEYLGRIGAII